MNFWIPFCEHATKLFLEFLVLSMGRDIGIKKTIKKRVYPIKINFGG